MFSLCANVDEPNSHGYIEYEINHDPGLSERNSIKSTANIYFDYKPAIVTNIAENVIATNLVSLEEKASSPYELEAYPNPNAGIAVATPKRGEE